MIPQILKIVDIMKPGSFDKFEDVYIVSELMDTDLHQYKPSNLLLNSNCDLKICDFGLARVANPKEDHHGDLTEYVATRWYRAPEIMLSWKEYTKAIDVWSVGCIFAEILGRKPLFPGEDYINQLHRIISVLGTPSFEDTEYIINAKAKSYVRSLAYQRGVDFKQLFPEASASGNIKTYKPGTPLSDHNCNILSVGSTHKDAAVFPKEKDNG
eukprot:1393660-Amorphochlora_amoeboformis.AAC.1